MGNEDEWGLHFTDSSEWGLMGLNNILILSIHPHSSAFVHICVTGTYGYEWRLMGMNNILDLSIHPHSDEWVKFNPTSSPFPIHSTCADVRTPPIYIP